MIDISDQKFIENPFLPLKDKREYDPICKIMPLNYWGITRHQDIVDISKNTEVFSSAAYQNANDLIPEFQKYFNEGSLIGMDPPLHHMMRRPLQKVFTQKYLQEHQAYFEQYCLSLIGQLKQYKNETFDFNTGFASPFPVEVIAHILGVKESIKSQFKLWSDGVLSLSLVSYLPPSPEKDKMVKDLVISQDEFQDYFGRIIDEKIKHPDDAMISLMISSTLDEHKYSKDQLFSMIRLFLVAGNETTTNLLNAMILVLAKRPDIMDQIKADPSLVPSFIEEVLRYDGPGFGLPRLVTRDYDFNGHQFKKGERVVLLISSGNRDESVFKNSETFDLSRDHSKSLAFGSGVHSCIGSRLARLEAEIALKAMLPEVKSIQIAQPVKRAQTLIVKGYSRVPIQIDWH